MYRTSSMVTVGIGTRPILDAHFPLIYSSVHFPEVFLKHPVAVVVQRLYRSGLTDSNIRLTTLVFYEFRAFLAGHLAHE